MSNKLSSKYRFTFSLLIFFTFIVGVTAQRGEMRQKIKEKIKVEKIGYITSELELTEAEAIKFWPIYNQYEDSKEGNREKMKSMIDDYEGNASTNLDNYLKFKEEEFLIEKTYIEKFKKVLPTAKVLKLITSEKRFKEELVSRVKQKMRRDRDR